jgi:SMC interacting uncharacterized protein involved in chromosome segregation
MDLKKEFEKLRKKLKEERDEINLKLHLASMEVKDEMLEAEKKWDSFKLKADAIAEGTKETSDEVIAKTKIVGEELKETYKRIKRRFGD